MMVFGPKKVPSTSLGPVHTISHFPVQFHNIYHQYPTTFGAYSSFTYIDINMRSIHNQF
ncbi:hypothetical protein Hanom_Chr08g00737991 [Helianthus anomalus]